MVGEGDDRVVRRHYGQFVLGGIREDMNITFWEDVKCLRIATISLRALYLDLHSHDHMNDSICML